MMRPTITVTRTSKAKGFMQRVQSMADRCVYVGIPASSVRDRKQSLIALSNLLTGSNSTSKQKKKYLQKAAETDINNAQLLFIFSKGSPLHKQPARPVLEPAITHPPNAKKIARELSLASRASLNGQPNLVISHLKRAGMAGQSATRGWFTNPANGWAQNAPSTIRRKLGKLRGKRRDEAMSVLDQFGGGLMPMVGQVEALDNINTPGIDTGAMYRAITYVIGGPDGPDQPAKSLNYSSEEEKSEIAKSFGGDVSQEAEQAGESVAKTIAETGERLI